MNSGVLGITGKRREHTTPPHKQVNLTFKKARKAKGKGGKPEKLPLWDLTLRQEAMLVKLQAKWSTSYGGRDFRSSTDLGGSAGDRRMNQGNVNFSV